MPPSTKSGAISLYGETPEEQEGIQRVKQTQRELREALESRQNQLFDPVMLALAQGFLSPTKAGGFGESIANAAALVGPAQEREQKRQMEMAQIRAELAAQELAQIQATRDQRVIRQMPSIYGGAPSAPAGQAPSPAAAQGLPSQAATGEAPAAQPAAITPAGQISSSNPDAMMAYLEKMMKSGSPQQKEAAKNHLELLKFGREGIKLENGIMIDTNRRDAEGKPIVLGDFRQEQKPAEITFKGVGMSIPMTGWELEKYKDAQQQGPAAEEAFFNRYLRGRRTTGQAAAESAQQKAFAEATGTDVAKVTRDKIALGDDAMSRRQIAESIQTLAQKEGMGQVVGIFEKPGIPAAIFKTIEEGISLGRGFGISAPQIREILSANKIQLNRNPGETKEQYDARVMDVISNLQQMSSLFAQSIFGLRSLAKGQGAISNLENEIFKSMAPTVRDTLQTIMAKTQHAKLRAEFDEKVANILLDENISWDQLRRDRKRYNQMVADYDKQLLSVYSGTSAGRAAGAAKPSGAKPSGGSAESAAVLREELGL